MTEQMLWADRTFDFSFPVGFYREILERLRGAPARMDDRVLGTPAELLKRRDGGKWSVQEHVAHLADLDETLLAGRLDDYAAEVTRLRPADMTNALTEEADHNALAIADVLDRFRQTRGVIVERLSALPPDALAQVAHHPRLNRAMRLVDLMYFHAEHDDYHIARVTELLGRFASELNRPSC